MSTNRPPSCDLPPEFYQTKLKFCPACGAQAEHYDLYNLVMCKKQETVRATRGDKCRYHLEKRSGVWAIYDLEHPAYTDSPGVHSDSPYVVASWSGEQVHDDETRLHYWQMPEWKQQQALALLALLNAGVA